LIIENKSSEMPEILRLFDGPSDYTDWKAVSTGYSLNDIEKIKDPASGTMKEVTSIPSPFARLHLFEHAFKVVTSEAKTSSAKLEGNSMFHKLVSDAFDVGETLFNYYTYDKNPNYNLATIRWNKKKDLDVLLSSSNKAHQLLGQALQLYLAQDQDGSNFHLMENIYLIQCNHEIIGGTSPSTLFFAAYNDDWRLAKLGLRQGASVFFDQDFSALHERSLDFQRYLHALFIAYPRLSAQMVIFYDYLKTSLIRLKETNYELFQEIKRMENGTYTLQDFNYDYEELTASSANDPIDIFDNVYHRKKKNVPADGSSSDLAIKADFTHTKVKGLIPLVLQNGFAKPLRYLYGNWNKDTTVPYAPKEKPEDRILPGQNEIYPYLTISDFLEPTLIRLEFRINKEQFFDGNPEGFSTGDKMNSIPPDASYLLPIKPLYFQYFSTATLQSKAPDGRPTFRMRKVGQDAIAIELRIPIKKENEVVTFERIYQLGVQPDEAGNKGAIVDYQINLGLFPAAMGNESFIQHIGLIDNDILFDTQYNRYQLSFFEEGRTEALVPAYQTQKSDKQRHQRNSSSLYYVMKQPYQAIGVDSGNARGMIVPKLRQLPGGSKQFTFAIDFGTSNTHIEYSVNEGSPQPFEIIPADLQLATLMETDAWYMGGVTKDLFMHEFVPELIGREHFFSFPIRTATTEIDNLDHQKTPGIISDINICFVYEKLQVLNNSHLQLNLKWQNYNAGPNAINRLRAFLGEIMLLIRNKIILNGGNLQATRLIWFYPSSMSVIQRNAFSRVWNELFDEYISTTNDPLSCPEAEAPLYTYLDTKIINHDYPVVNIDIGGGTTDIVIFEKNQPKVATSLTFAGNVVWGEGYSKLSFKDNGFVSIFKPVAQRFLEANQNNGLYNLFKTYEQIINSQDKGSADIMSFFFSIDKNREVLNRNLKFDFSSQIGQNEDFKIIFIVFYTSILYYTARMMKTMGLKLPRFICLTGNGSKIAGLLDLDPKLRQTVRLSQKVFELVYKEYYYADGLDMIQNQEPKESTCKGGIMRLKMSSQSDYENVCWLGDKPSDQKTERTIVYTASEKQLKYDQLTSEFKQSVIQEYYDYLDLLKQLNDSVNFANNFGARNEKLPRYIEILKKDASGFLESGIHRRLEWGSKEDTIGETLFFYPLIGALYRLTQEIAEGNV
jgi:hypothetical protein